MRHERWPYQGVKFGIELVIGGVAQTGLTVTATVQRDDGQYLQDGGGWAGTTDDIPIPELSAGYYVFEPAAGDISCDHLSYLVTFEESTIPVEERLTVIPVVELGTSISDPADLLAESLADLLWRTSRLRQHNVRVEYTDWFGSGQPKEGEIRTFQTRADCLADTNVQGTYAFTATEDGQARITSYVSTRES